MAIIKCHIMFTVRILCTVHHALYAVDYSIDHTVNIVKVVIVVYAIYMSMDILSYRGGDK